MKCINKTKKLLVILLSITLILCGTGCGSPAYDLPYSANSDVSSFNVVSTQDSSIATPFADKLCVVEGNKLIEELKLEDASSAILLHLDDRDVVYAKEPHMELYPASITKIMTALIAVKYGNLNQILTATDNCKINESGAQLCGVKTGDTMTLDQALRILLVYSANDVALMIAESVGGTVEGFIDMMNNEAQRLGATNTHFANPHGLTDANHYTTVYDLYLIFNEALKYETINEIIQMTGYQTVYYDKNGKEKSFDKQTTNLFLREDYSAPAKITVIGGKTGTTAAAGHCLLLLARNVTGSPYIAIVMGVPSTEQLYKDMIELLDEIH